MEERSEELEDGEVSDRKEPMSGVIVRKVAGPSGIFMWALCTQ